MKSVSRLRRVSSPPSGRVLIVCQPTVDGVAVCVRDLVGAAVDAGYDVTVACPSAGALANWITERGAIWAPLEMRRSPHLSDIRAVARVRALARAHALVHLHSSKAGTVGRLALTTLGRDRPPSIFTPHGWSWLVGGRLPPLYRLIERLLFRRTTAVVAVSAEERASAQAALGPAADRILVNPNGVDVSRFCPQGPVASRSSDPLVVAVGRLCHQRAPDIAVAALALMRTPSVRLRLVGDGADRPKIEEQAGALGLRDRVEMAGFRPDPAPDLRAADVVIVPSRYDGMALVLLEAMACGAAIVATQVAGASALRGAGTVVPVEDPQSLAAAADALLADPDHRRELGSAARERVTNLYSLKNSLQSTLRLWRDLGALPSGGSAPGLDTPTGAIGHQGGHVSPGESHEAITLQRVVQVIWRQRLACAIVALVVLLVGLGVVLSRPKTYQSTSSVALLPAASNPGILPNYPNLIISLMPTYVQLVSSPILLDKVAATLPFHTSAAQLANDVHAESLSNAAIIDIVARSSSAIQAQQIAARTTQAFLRQLRGNGVVIPKVYGQPTLPTGPASPKTTLLLLLILVLAVIAGPAAGLVWDRLFGGTDDEAGGSAEPAGPTPRPAEHGWSAPQTVTLVTQPGQARPALPVPVHPELAHPEPAQPGLARASAEPSAVQVGAGQVRATQAGAGRAAGPGPQEEPGRSGLEQKATSPMPQKKHPGRPGQPAGGVSPAD